MKLTQISLPAVLLTMAITLPSTVHAATEFMNDTNTIVTLGASMAAEPFQNRSTTDSLASLMDLDNAAMSENHSQTTHIWVSGGTLELDFDLGDEYNLTTLHFWNYFGETYDVDEIDFTFYDSTHTLVGTIFDFVPLIGSAIGSVIAPEDYTLNFPSNVQYINAVFSGSNNEVDFNNIGFSGMLSAGTVTPPSTVSEPMTFGILSLGLIGFSFLRRRSS